MSQVYFVKHKPKSRVDFDSPFSINFDSDERGGFAVIAFRVSLSDLRWLLKSKARFIQVWGTEIAAVLRAIVANEKEPTEERTIANNLLGEK